MAVPRAFVSLFCCLLAITTFSLTSGLNRSDATSTTSVPSSVPQGSSPFPELGPRVEAALESAPLARTDIKTVLEAWSVFARRAPIWANKWVNSLQPQLQAILNKTSISSDCRESLLAVAGSVEKLEEWAIKLMDSWGRLPMAGILDGTLTDFGDYDECLGVEPNSLIGAPQYCTVELRPLLPYRPRFHNLVHTLRTFHNFSSLEGEPNQIFQRLISSAHYFYYITLRLGVCLPSKCSYEEVDTLVNEAGKNLVLQGRAVRCEQKQLHSTLDSYQVTAIITLFSFTFVALLGTALDLLYVRTSNLVVQRQSPLKRCLLAFSVPRNFASVFQTKTGDSNLGCLHGVRFLTMGWVVMGHTYALTNHQTFARGFRITSILTEFSGQWFFNATLSVDTFFFMSGLLTTYVTWKMTKGERKNLNIAAFILARVFRLTPPLMAVVVLTYLLPLFGSGPGFHEMIDPVVEGCKKNWWTNLLYLNNWVDTRNICLLHTWYLSNDMHFHILSLIVILPLLRSKNLGLAINLALLASFTLITAIINYRMDYPPAMLYTQPEIEERWDYILDFYFKPYSHVGAYCVGLALGYMLATQKLNKLTSWQRFSGWSFSLLTLFGVLYGVYGWNVGYTSHAVVNALYSSTHRTLWAAGLAWIVYACVTGQGGFVNKLLTWKGFVAMSRLTFMVYLVHPWLIWIYMGNLRQRVDTSHYTAFYIFVPHWLLSYLLGLILTLLVESPFMVLQKELLKYLTTSSEGGANESALRTSNGTSRPIILSTYTKLATSNGHDSRPAQTSSLSKENNNRTSVRSLTESPYAGMRRSGTYSSSSTNGGVSVTLEAPASSTNGKDFNTDI